MIPFGIAWNTFAKLYGAAAAVAVLIFLLRVARRGRAVSSTLIWQKVMGKAQSLWRELLSLIIQLLILLLICLALVDLQPPAEEIQRRWVGLIFDTSESMTAREGEASRLRLAEREAWRMIASLSEVDRATIISAANEVNALTPFTGDKEELKNALTELKAAGTRPKITEAIAYALGAFDYADIGPKDSKHLFVLTDRPDQVIFPELTEVEAGAVGIGRSLANVAITAFDVRKTMNMTETYEALVNVRNYSAGAAGANLTIFTPEQKLGTETIQLAAGGEYAKVIGLPFGINGKITALLQNVQIATGAADGLTSDDAAFTFVPPVRKARVLLVSKKNVFLYNALALNPEIELTSIKPAEYQHGLTAEVDVAIFDMFTPPTVPICSAVYFHPGSAGPFQIVESKKKPAMTGWADGHPLLRHVSMDTLNIESARILAPQDGDVVLMGHFENALMLLRPRGEGYLLGVGFNLAKTDLPLQTAFPIFMHNVVHLFSQRPTEEEVTSYRLGEQVELYVTPGRPQVVLQDPLDKKIGVTVRAGLGLFRPTVPGFYTYADAEALRIFAASLLDEEESNLAVTDTGNLPVYEQETQEEAPDIPRPWLVLAALLLIAFDMVLFLNGKLA
ncbi:MAG: vWA domain-containing protein [Alphaproteobacteria bacterium]